MIATVIKRTNMTLKPTRMTWLKWQGTHAKSSRMMTARPLRGWWKLELAKKEVSQFYICPPNKKKSNFCLMFGHALKLQTCICLLLKPLGLPRLCMLWKKMATQAKALTPIKMKGRPNTSSSGRVGLTSIALGRAWIHLHNKKSRDSRNWTTIRRSKRS